MNNEGVKRKTRGSKSRKKGWKNVDITDVEQHLEDVRRDERTGGPASKVQDQNLFFVEKVISEKEAASSKKRSRVKKADSDDDDEEVYVSKKQLYMESLYKEKEDELKKNEEKKSHPVINVWGQEQLTVQDSYLESTVKKPIIKPITVNQGKLLGIKAVKTPHPGTSYNPDYDSHQSLLAVANEEEEGKLKGLIKLNNKVKMVSVAELKKQGDVWMQEMSEGLNKKEKESESESEEDVEGIVLPPKKKKEKKTKQQRRKQKMIKIQDGERIEAKRDKLRKHEIFRLRSMRKEIRKAEEAHALKMEEKKKQMEVKDLTHTKRLGKCKFREDGVNYKISEELTGTLREMKPEGNLIKDGFRSMQRRNIIEVRRPVVAHRRYKRKMVVRRSYIAPNIRDFNPMRKKVT